MNYFVLLFVVIVAVEFTASENYRVVEAEDGRFPYHVALSRWVTSSDFSFICSGALISETFIITAAHCVFQLDPAVIKARLGSVDREEGTERKARKKIVHPDFDWDNQHRSDIALLEIDSIDYSETIGKVELPSCDDSGINFEGHMAVSTGWQLARNEKRSSFLQYVYFLVLKNDVCDKAHQYEYQQDIICAANPDPSAVCGDDSVSLLVHATYNNLIGIYSYVPGMNCSVNYFGYAYTRVDTYRSWICDEAGI